MKKLTYICLAFISLAGNLFSQEVSGIVTDIDGNKYNQIIIGSQVWMSEDLKVTRFNNGEAILNVQDNLKWFNLATPGYCWYNDTRSKAELKALYNWHTVNKGELCPAGWHVPSDREWAVLIDYLQNSPSGMKLSGKTIVPAAEASRRNNSMSGFPHLPGGVRIGNGSFSLPGFNYWWTSKEGDVNRGVVAYMYDDEGNMSFDRYGKNYGFSVRCIKD